MSTGGGGTPVVPAERALGELPALLLLPGFALFGSEFAGVILSSADKLALFALTFAFSGPTGLGGDTE